MATQVSHTEDRYPSQALAQLRIAVSGGTGHIGSALIAELKARGDDVVVLSRDPDRAASRLGIDAFRWRPEDELAPSHAVDGRDAVVHLAGEDVAQRWTSAVKKRIYESRVRGTSNLVATIEASRSPPAVLLSASGHDYYGARGSEPVTECNPPGTSFMATTCRAWEEEAGKAERLGARVVKVRTGLVLDREPDGPLMRMAAMVRLGVGGPVAGGRQFIPWIHIADEVAMLLSAIDDSRWSGPVNAVAPNPVMNREFARVLGRLLNRPTFVPIPEIALRLIYGEMCQLLTDGRRALPARAQAFGFKFQFPNLEAALADLVS